MIYLTSNFQKQSVSLVDELRKSNPRFINIPE